MRETIPLKTDVRLGIVPTHLRFAGGLVPDENGRYARDEEGAIRVISGLREMLEISPVALKCVQISLFPGTDPAELEELVSGLRALDLEFDFIIMLAGVNPMDPAHEDAVVAQLLPGLKAAATYGTRHISSTSIEEWMSADESPRDDDEFEAAVKQNVKVHLRAYREAGLEESSVEDWHIEFLRPGEFKTFTNLERAWAFVAAANKTLGKPFFKILLDAAHCGDSGLGIAENEALVRRIAAAGELGIFHASAKTTRGCLSTDDGWIAALLTAAARTGALRHVFVELFDHEDPGLEALRAIEPRHGVDTRDGRAYPEVLADGLADIARRLNNLAARGILKPQP